MALEAKRAAFNLAVTAAILAWDDLVDGLAQNAVVLLVPVQGNRNGAAMVDTSNPPGLATTDSAVNMTKFSYKIPATNSSTASMLYSINDSSLLPYLPLFWKCTNDAGELA